MMVLPPRRRTKLSIAIPSSLVSEIPHFREKTAVIGLLGRAAAVFRVDDIYIYRDRPDEGRLIGAILRYMETPQYLRRLMFGMRAELRYVGILPPLRTPHHPLRKKAEELKPGEVREGLVLSSVRDAYLVDVGVDKPIRVRGRPPSPIGRVTVRIIQSDREPEGVFIGKEEVEIYWGFEIHRYKGGIGRLAMEGGFDLAIATSRYGVPYPVVEGQLRESWRRSRRILVAFGSPRRGLRELLKAEGLTLKEAFHFTINTIPNQGCETVRTEEAVFATLALLNLLEAE
jgi:hypothetical protein